MSTTNAPPAVERPAVPTAAPEPDTPAPTPTEELVCTLCGLSACWTPKRSAAERTS